MLVKINVLVDAEGNIGLGTTQEEAVDSYNEYFVIDGPIHVLSIVLEITPPVVVELNGKVDAGKISATLSATGEVL